MKRKFQVTLLLFGLLFSLCESVYFMIDEGTEKCLLDDLHKNQVVIGQFEILEKTFQKESGKKTGFLLYVSDPNGKRVYSKRVQQKEKFTITALEYGEYSFCVYAGDMEYLNLKKARYSLKLLGDVEKSFEEIAKTEHITHLQYTARVLSNKTQELIDIQEYERSDEDKLSEENEKVNNRVVYTTIFQTIAILVSGIIQILSLKKFFESKRMF